MPRGDDPAMIEPANPPKPPSRDDFVRYQRNVLSEWILDMEADIVMLQAELQKALARVAELEPAEVPAE